jgi:putative intracellular protease/amidase
MKNIGILLFNDIELLDFAGPYEVFSVTDELNIIPSAKPLLLKSTVKQSEA